MQGLSTHVAGRQILPLNFATTSLVKILDFKPFLALAPLNKVGYVLKKLSTECFFQTQICQGIFLFSAQWYMVLNKRAQ